MEGAPILTEARSYVERAIGGLETLHVGPLDYNVFSTCDYLRTAALLIEQYAREVAGGA
jgi:hypothetical protein